MNFAGTLMGGLVKRWMSFVTLEAWNVAIVA
jgi:hypothetical protein